MAGRRWLEGTALFRRRRRKTFSTPINASSTSSPIAIAIPPRVRLLIVIPKYLRATRVVHSESGMADKRDSARPRVCKERDHHNERQQSAIAQGLPEVRYRCLDELGLSEDTGVNLDARRERRLDLVEIRDDSACQIESVALRLLADPDDHGRTSVQRTLPAPQRLALPHRAKIPDVYGCCVPGPLRRCRESRSDRRTGRSPG